MCCAAAKERKKLACKLCLRVWGCVKSLASLPAPPALPALAGPSGLIATKTGRALRRLTMGALPLGLQLCSEQRAEGQAAAWIRRAFLARSVPHYDTSSPPPPPNSLSIALNALTPPSTTPKYISPHCFLSLRSRPCLPTSSSSPSVSLLRGCRPVVSSLLFPCLLGAVPLARVLNCLPL